MKNITCELVSLRTVYELSYRLALRIQASGYRPDIAVAIARGGFVPARFLCDFLGLSDLASIKVQHYKPGATREQKAWIKYPLCADVSGKNVLLIDDVNDSGETLIVAQEHIRQFQPAELKVAVLHQKQTTTFHADFIAHVVRWWRWMIYPWAVIEDVTAFLQKLQPAAVSNQEMVDRLRKDYGIRLPIPRLERILQLHTTNTPPTGSAPGA